MTTILQQLYNGEIFPAEQYRPMQQEYKRMRQEHYRHYEDFIRELDKLEPSLSKRFIEIMDEQLDAVPFECSELFTGGFRLGAQLMLEVLRGGQDGA